jgi:hypothetical protein
MPEPGWYNHPTDQQLIAEWNGEKWTGNTQPNPLLLPPPSGHPVQITIQPTAPHPQVQYVPMHAPAQHRSIETEIALLDKESDSTLGLAIFALFLCTPISIFTLFKSLSLRGKYATLGQTPHPKTSWGVGVSLMTMVLAAIVFLYAFS